MQVYLPVLLCAWCTCTAIELSSRRATNISGSVIQENSLDRTSLTSAALPEDLVSNQTLGFYHTEVRDGKTNWSLIEVPNVSVELNVNVQACRIGSGRSGNGIWGGSNCGHKSIDLNDNAFGAKTSTCTRFILCEEASDCEASSVTSAIECAQKAATRAECQKDYIEWRGSSHCFCNPTGRTWTPDTSSADSITYPTYCEERPDYELPESGKVSEPGRPTELGSAQACTLGTGQSGKGIGGGTSCGHKSIDLWDRGFGAKTSSCTRFILCEETADCESSSITSATECAEKAATRAECQKDFIEWRGSSHCFCNPAGHTWTPDTSYAGSITYPTSCQEGLRNATTPDFKLSEPGAPMIVPTPSPTPGPTENPTLLPTVEPSLSPTPGPTEGPTVLPTVEPSLSPTPRPTEVPTVLPTVELSPSPTNGPTEVPTLLPTTPSPTINPTPPPTLSPTASPTVVPSRSPTTTPTVAYIMTEYHGSACSGDGGIYSFFASSVPTCAAVSFNGKMYFQKSTCSGPFLDFSWHTDANCTSSVNSSTPERFDAAELNKLNTGQCAKSIDGHRFIATGLTFNACEDAPLAREDADKEELEQKTNSKTSKESRAMVFYPPELEKQEVQRILTAEEAKATGGINFEALQASTKFAEETKPRTEAPVKNDLGTSAKGRWEDVLRKQQQVQDLLSQLKEELMKGDSLQEEKDGTALFWKVAWAEKELKAIRLNIEEIKKLQESETESE